MTEITKKSVAISWLLKLISHKNLTKENVLNCFVPLAICRGDYHIYLFKPLCLSVDFLVLFLLSLGVCFVVVAGVFFLVYFLGSWWLFFS